MESIKDSTVVGQAKQSSEPIFRPPFSSSVNLVSVLSPGTTINDPTLRGSTSGASFYIPASYHNQRYNVLRPTDDMEAFLRYELCVPRLHKIYSHLWLAGRKGMPARPLHRQAMMDREISVTEQVDLHLVWGPSRIFIKPLPAYLLDIAFWKEYLCSDKELHESASGFLLSYAWLISRESDFQIATRDDVPARLLPKGLSWGQWVTFMQDFLHGIDLDDHKRLGIDRRYHFGELRANRLNMIYRLAPALRFQYFLRGYYFGYNQYNVFFRRNFAWLIVAFAYITIILTAMQVGLATSNLSKDDRFQAASYGFAVFSILVPVVMVGIAVLVFAVLFTANLLSTIVNLHNRRRSAKDLG